MGSKVGYQTVNPNERSPKELNDWYSKLKIGTNYFQNGLEFRYWVFERSWKKLSKPTDRNEWAMTSSTVNAYNDQPLNQIVFPSGIMQTPNFSGDLPDYVSYGAMGSTVGHEMTHGFDDNGAKYDETGRYKEWWDNSTTNGFTKQSDCFVNQYAQYSVVGLEGEKVPINGKLTLGENIADCGGLNNAYRAWKKREVASGKPNPGLPGLEKFTNDQLFFISYANSWCDKTRNEALLKQVLSDPHSPANTRTNGPTDNSVDFKRIFNCPTKEAKCDLW
jgi:endothelin-converting enzyme